MHSKLVWKTFFVLAFLTLSDIMVLMKKFMLFLSVFTIILGFLGSTSVVFASGGQKSNTFLSLPKCNSLDFSLAIFIPCRPIPNSAPVIRISINPTTVQVGQPVSFTWNATDADKDNLSWSVSFTDYPGGGGGGSSCPSLQANRAFSFSHTWNTPGTYQVKATVKDCRGGIDVDTIIVTVNP